MVRAGGPARGSRAVNAYAAYRKWSRERRARRQIRAVLKLTEQLQRFAVVYKLTSCETLKAGTALSGAVSSPALKLED